MIPALELEVPEAGGALVRTLSPGHLAGLLAARDLVKVVPAAGGAWQISGRRRIGVVRIGSGDSAIVLHLRPKLPVDSLLFLLSYAAGDRMWRETEVTMGTQQGLLPAVAILFARMASRALDGGVLHGYRETTDTLYAVRGRVDMQAQLRRSGLPLPVAVEFDEFTADIPENQILVAALRRLLSVPDLPARTQPALRHLLGRLAEVSAPPLGSRLPKWTPNRLNARYGPALRLATLLLDDLSPDIRLGDEARTDGIVIDMERLFESFLESALVDIAGSHGLRCVRQQHQYRLDAAQQIKIRPDVAVYRGTRLLTVIDAKYKVSGDGIGHHPDLYQVIAYCAALGLSSGHLVYAAGPTNPQTHRIGPPGTAVSVHGIDLCAPPGEVLACVDRIACAAGT